MDRETDPTARGKTDMTKKSKNEELASFIVRDSEDGETHFVQVEYKDKPVYGDKEKEELESFIL
jgi:hypothetical protein